jgi:hypothetical protein
VKRLLPWMPLAISIAVLPFVGLLALVALASRGAALAYSRCMRRASA